MKSLPLRVDIVGKAYNSYLIEYQRERNIAIKSKAKWRTRWEHKSR